MKTKARVQSLILSLVALVLIGILGFVNLSPGIPSNPQTPGKVSAYDQSWANIQLVDVLTGRQFKTSDFKGKTVFVELMAIWCPACTRQQAELSRLTNFYKLGDKIVIVSIDIDANERPEDLAQYARSQGHMWLWSVDSNRTFDNFFRRTPPETPVIVIAPDGSFTVFSGKITKAPEFLAHLETFGVRP